jgi:DegV family protein with EDD domain
MKKNYIITTDSCADMQASFMAENNIPFISLMFTLEGITYEDDFGETMSSRAFYSRIKAGEHSTTTQVTPARYTEFFETYLEHGYDILHISFSSSLSGSCASAVSAAEKLKYKYPDRCIIVIDSLCASMGQGLLLTYAVRLRHGGAQIDEVASWLDQNKPNICHYFTVNDLFHLYRGGRVTKTSAMLGSLIGIKPVLRMDDNGRLVPVGKVRGRTQALNELLRYMERLAVSPEAQTVYISHGDCLEDAEYLAAAVKRRLNVKQILINPVGPVIGSHTGQGVIALFFIGTSR